jgi:alpha-1,2-mannosyltransferase
MRNRIEGWVEALRGLPEGRALRVAVFIWVVYGLVIATIVAIQPDRRTVTPEYREAAEEWWAGEDIYEVRMHGYLYLPHCALIYSPYAMLPLRVGEPLWRLTGIGLLGWSLWRLAGMFGGGRRGLVFLLATVAALPASFSAARNGQANLAMAGLLALAAFDFGIRAWNRGVLSLLFSFALKPLGAVPCLLAAGTWPLRLSWRFGVGLVLLALVGFVHWNPEFAARQYGLFVQTLQIAGKPNQALFCDLAGMFGAMGIAVPDPMMTGARVLAALATLGLAVVAARRYDAARAGFVCMALAALYLLLFNPRTETNSYVLVAPFAGIWAALAFVQGAGRRFWWLLAYAAVLSCENWGPLHQVTNLWLKALASLVVLVVLGSDLLRARSPLGLPSSNDPKMC